MGGGGGDTRTMVSDFPKRLPENKEIIPYQTLVVAWNRSKESRVSDPRFGKNAHYLHTIWKLMRTTVDLDGYFQFCHVCLETSF